MSVSKNNQLLSADMKLHDLSNIKEFYNFMKFINVEPKILEYKFLVRPSFSKFEKALFSLGILWTISDRQFKVT